MAKEKQPKKLVLFNILDILKRYTDENHRLSQKEIEEILRKEYDMTVDRKTVKTSLMNLEEFGYELEYSESLRPIKNKKTGEVEDSYILSDFYLRKDFEDSELRLLIDSLLFSKHLPYSQCTVSVDVGYIFEDDIKENYVKYMEYPHKCSECGGKSKVYKSFESKAMKNELKCPNCDGVMGVDATRLIMWD